MMAGLRRHGVLRSVVESVKRRQVNPVQCQRASLPVGACMSGTVEMIIVSVASCWKLIGDVYAMRVQELGKVQLCRSIQLTKGLLVKVLHSRIYSP